MLSDTRPFVTTHTKSAPSQNNPQMTPICAEDVRKISRRAAEGYSSLRGGNAAEAVSQFCWAVALRAAFLIKEHSQDLCQDRAEAPA